MFGIEFCSLFVCRSLPVAWLQRRRLVCGGRAADGRGSRRHHHQGDTPFQPRVAERVAGLGKVLGCVLHRGDATIQHDLIQLDMRCI